LQDQREADFKRLKKERKEFQKYHENVLEELVPKATGRLTLFI